MARHPHHVLSVFLLLMAAGLFVTSQSEGRTEVVPATFDVFNTPSLDNDLTCHVADDEMCFANESHADMDGVDLVPQADSQCMDACRKSVPAFLVYCGTIPFPQVKVACYGAAAVGGIGCVAFCLAK